MLQGHIAGGYFDVQCNGTSDAWIAPTAWPAASDCAAGDNCSLPLNVQAG